MCDRAYDTPSSVHVHTHTWVPLWLSHNTRGIPMAQVTQPNALCTYLGSIAGPKEVATLGECQHARSHDNSRTTQESSQPIFELPAGPTLGICTHAPKPRTPRGHRLTCHGPKARSEALREATAEGCWGRRSLEWGVEISPHAQNRRSLPGTEIPSGAQSKSERSIFYYAFTSNL